MMSCDLYKAVIMEYLDGKLTGAKEEKLELHLQQCASCREFLSAQEKQHAMLRNIPLFTPGIDFTHRVMKEIHHKKDALYLKRLLFFLLLPLVSGITALYLWWPQIILVISFITIYAVNGIKVLIAVTNDWLQTAFCWLGIIEKIVSGFWWAQGTIFKIILEIFNWYYLEYIIVALMFMGTFFMAKIFPQHKKS